MQSFAARTHQVRSSLLHGTNGQRRPASRPIGETVQRPYHPAAEFRPCVKLDHDRRSASYSKQLLGCGCGVSVASIMRPLLAPLQSSFGDRMRRATNYALALAAPVAAAKVQNSSIQAGRQSHWLPAVSN